MDSCSSYNQDDEKANKLFFITEMIWKSKLEDFIGGNKTVSNPLAGKPAPKSMLIDVPRLNQKEVTSNGMEAK